MSLKFPGKVDAIHTQHPSFPLESQTVIVISDTGNHRVLIIDEISHRLLVTIGSGKKGFKDGTFATAQFDSPQVVCTLISGKLLHSQTKITPYFLM